LDPTSNISRYVAFALQPIVTLAVAVVAVKAKAWFGVDLNTGEILALVLGTIVSFVTWLINRGRFEIRERFGDNSAADYDTVLRLIEERLPAAQAAPAPGAGSPASPRAPGQ
jgi:hypothetical protein